MAATHAFEILKVDGRLVEVQCTIVHPDEGFLPTSLEAWVSCLSETTSLAREWGIDVPQDVREAWSDEPTRAEAARVLSAVCVQSVEFAEPAEQGPQGLLLERTADAEHPRATVRLTATTERIVAHVRPGMRWATAPLVFDDDE